MEFFDSHAHFWDDRFFSDECEDVDGLLRGLFAGGICGILNVATSPDNYERVISQAARYPRMYTALGIHPTDCETLTGSVDGYMSDLRERLLDVTNKAVALGEIGLDYHYDGFDKQKQQTFFRAQLSLARELDIPVSIHDRDAHGDTFDILSEYLGVRGVLHSFSGSAELAKEYARRGFFISFSGVISFKGARKTVEAAQALPVEQVLIETDCPYLAPTPHRGQLNHSGFLRYTCEALASALGMTPEECAAVTAENARRLFRIPDKGIF